MSGDLTTYAGRAKRRPPGASDFTQRLYRLLHEHSEGMTRAEIHDALRDGWMETDAYRAYVNRLARRRKVYPQGPPGNTPYRRGTPPAEPGTAEFKERAQRWWIILKLNAMRQRGNARCEGDGDSARWFAARAPRVRVEMIRTSGYAPFNPVESRAVLTATTTEHVNRENAKAELLALLNDKRIKGRTRDGIQAAFDWLCGRR